MTEKCRVDVYGFDPLLVKGYVAGRPRTLWWHLSDEIYEEYHVKPGDMVSGKLLAVYDGDGNQTAAPNEPFEWKTSRESGLAVLLPYDIITKYRLTEGHFIELLIEKINEKEVFPLEERMSTRWWTDDKMKLTFGEKVLGYLSALYK